MFRVVPVLLAVFFAPALAGAQPAQSSPKLLSAPPGAPSERSTPHLRLVWYAVPDRLSPERPVSLVVEVTPAPGMRIYAPGQLQYVPVGVTFDANPAVAFGTPRLPKPVEHVFGPTGERSLVYDRPFRIDIPVSLARGKSPVPQKPNGPLKIGGTFEYQACDEALCYRPARVPVSWTLETGPAQAPSAPPR